MNSAIYRLRLVSLIVAISVATLCEPQASQGQAPAENAGTDYRGTIDRFLEWERENPEPKGQKDEFELRIERESAHQREVNANQAGRYLCDVDFSERGDQIAFGLEGKQLFCGLQDGSVRVVNVDSQKFAAAIRFAENPITNVVVSPDGRRLIVGCAVEKSVYTWDLVAGKQIAKVVPAKPWLGDEMALSADGRYAALAGYSSEIYEYTAYLGRRETSHVVDPRVYVYNTQSGKLLRSVRCNDGATPFLMSPDGSTFAVHGGGAEGIRLWKYRRTTDPIDPVARITLHGSCSFSPDGKLVAAVVAMQDDRQMPCLALQLFASATGKKTGEYPLGQWNHWGNSHRGYAYAPVFSPSGNSVAFSRYEPYGKIEVNGKDCDMFSICILNLKTSRKTYLPRKDLEARAICFSPDGRRLAAILGLENENLTVRIWEVPSDGPAHSALSDAAVSAAAVPPSEPFRGFSNPNDALESASSTAGGSSVVKLAAASTVMLLVILTALRAKIFGKSGPIPISQVLPTRPLAADASQVPTMAPVVELGGPIQVDAMNNPVTDELSSNNAVQCPACAKKLHMPSGLKVGTKVSCKRCLCVFRTGSAKSVVARTTHLADIGSIV